MEKGSGKANRGHNCEANTNKQLVSHGHDGAYIVSEFRCRRCGRTWIERKSKAEILAGMVSR